MLVILKFFFYLVINGLYYFNFCCFMERKKNYKNKNLINMWLFRIKCGFGGWVLKVVEMEKLSWKVFFVFMFKFYFFLVCGDKWEGDKGVVFCFLIFDFVNGMKLFGRRVVCLSWI